MSTIGERWMRIEANTLAADHYPFTLALTDLSKLEAVRAATDLLADQLRQGLPANHDLSATQQPLTVTLDTTLIDEHQLYAIAPASLPAALYNVTVIQEDGRSSTLVNAYAITSPDNDDLYSSSYNLISDPAAPHAGEAAQLFLTLYRQGGKNPLAGVTVEFYQGDPDNDGSLIGSATTSILPVNASVQSSALNWTPAAPGKYTLCALIDPANAISESSEYNNLVCRTITVLPAHADKLAPDITSFELVPDGMEETTAPTLTVSVVAADVVRNGFATSGMSAVTFDEYVYNHANNLWVPIKRSPWTIYSPDAVEKLYDIELSPLPGMRYLKVWALDNAGNISHFPGERLVNFNQPAQSVQRNQSTPSPPSPSIPRFPAAVRPANRAKSSCRW